jgi:protease IV
MAGKGTRLLLWITALGLLILVAGGVAAYLLMGDGAPRMAENERWLHLRTSSGTSDAPGNEGFLMDPNLMPALTTEVTRALRDAAVDPTVKGLFLEIQPVGQGWGQVEELRDAVTAFRDAGKPCVALADAYTNKEYYLASACGEIYLSPGGITLVNGLAVTQTYYAGTFEKLGISANFEHVGDFKSAIEPYQRTGPSEAASAATELMLDGLFENFVAGIAVGRGMDNETARQLVDDPPMTPDDALARGLVDALSFRDQVIDERIGKDIELQRFGEFLQDRRQDWTSGDQVIAIVHVDGAIVGGDSGSELFGGTFVGDTTVRKLLEDIREDEDVVAMVLRVNSPGGSGGASDNMHREIALTREKMPVVASMADYAASGGYYVAMGTDWIVAQPSTLTGSIGVFGGKLNMHGLYEKAGVSTHTTQRGAYANLLSSDSDFDEAGRARFRTFLQGFYDKFVSKAAEGRSMSIDEMHAVAQGRVWTGRQALDRGLVDELGGLDRAVAVAAEKAGVDVNTVRLVRYPERKGFLDELLEELTDPESNAGEAALADALLPTTDLQAAVGDLNLLERVLGQGGVAAILPGRVDVR